jgi:hypothetical protein
MIDKQEHKRQKQEMDARLRQLTLLLGIEVSHLG